jgi:hypothetical protein
MKLPSEAAVFQAFGPYQLLLMMRLAVDAKVE